MIDVITVYVQARTRVKRSLMIAFLSFTDSIDHILDGDDILIFHFINLNMETVLNLGKKMQDEKGIDAEVII